jgi:predicted small metal-binding protein
MKKTFPCAAVVPGCDFAASAATEDELLKQVAEHAAEAHGLADVPPELVEKVKSAIRTEASP